MGFLDSFRKKTAAPTKKAAVKTSVDVADIKNSEPSSTTAQKVAGGNELSFRLLRKPHVSEKAARLVQQGTYVFDVPVTAEKIAIKKAVESLYHVKVVAVRTIRHEGKPVRRGRRITARKAWKKALVTLQQGQKIDIYEGV